jgi:outer membrane lipoprotein-sorting protein
LSQQLKIKELSLRCYILVLVFISSLATSVQAATTAVLQDPELAQLLSFYQSIDRLETSFHQVKRMKQMKMQLKSEGRLKIHRPDEVQWEITKPSHVLAAFDQKTVRLETGEGEQKTVQVLNRNDLSERKEAQALKSLTTWMQMDPVALSQEYEIQKLQPEYYQFTPKQKESSPFEKIELKISQKKFIRELSLFEKSGDTIQITFETPQFQIKK